MKNYTIGQICSKEIFIDVTGKEWMVSGFSDKDDNDKDWYNIYDYNLVSSGKDWESYFKKNMPDVTMVAMFDHDKEEDKRPMLTVEDLYKSLVQLNFERY
jgi:hypothetical protein